MVKPSKGNIHHNIRKQYFVNIGLRSEARFPCYGHLKIKEMPQASTLSFKIGRCTSERWLPDPMERSSSRMKSPQVHSAITVSSPGRQ